MLERIISGGQTGVDQSGWRAAKRFGLATGGWMPRGFKTEDGDRPDFATLYGAQEHVSPLYPPRTEKNVSEADGTLWLGSGDSRGFGCTIKACRKFGCPSFIVKTRAVKPIDAAEWIKANSVTTLNVAGNRESTSPGIGERAEEFLCDVFRFLLLDEALSEALRS